MLLDCDKVNLGSAKTMQALGGKMIYEYFDSEKDMIIQNYVFDVNESLRKNKEHLSGMVTEYPE